MHIFSLQNIETPRTDIIVQVDSPAIDLPAIILTTATPVSRPPICVENPDLLYESVAESQPVSNRPENLDNEIPCYKIYGGHLIAFGFTGLMCYVLGPQKSCIPSSPIFWNGVKNGSGLIFSCFGGDKKNSNPNCLEINFFSGFINLLCLGNFCSHYPNESDVVPYALQTIEVTS